MGQNVGPNAGARPMTRPKMSGQCCGNCKWLDISDYSLTGGKRLRWKRDAGGYCVWPQPQLVLPISITSTCAFRQEYGRSHCRVSDTGCPTWEPMEENAK